MPKPVGGFLYWPFFLVIQGRIAGFAIGEQEYSQNNPRMTYGDACEGCKSNALMRLCKGIGISLELWKPSLIREWKSKYAETYEDVDKQGKKKTKWRKKGQVANGNGSMIDMEEVKESSEKLASGFHDKIIETTSLDGLKTVWALINKEKNNLLPEHLQMLEQIKNEMKGKLTNA